MIERQPGKAIGLLAPHAQGAPAHDRKEAGRRDKGHDRKYKLPVFVEDAVEHGGVKVRVKVKVWVKKSG